MGEWKIPICFVCNKPVEYFSRSRDSRLQHNIFQANCHGRIETVSLSDADLIRCDYVLVGYAFKGGFLPTDPPAALPLPS